MEPKFQSSFIPKGTVAASMGAPAVPRAKERSILGLLSTIIFAASVMAALAVFGYGFYLNYSIDRMTVELESAKAAIEPESVSELLRLNNRIISTKELLGSHLVLSPLFEFLEKATLKTVRFTDLNYVFSEGALVLSMKGEARSYEALALQADTFNKSDYFKGPVFSDLKLADNGNVVFSVKTVVEPALLSYARLAEAMNIQLQPFAAPAQATSTASTSSPQTATSTSSRRATTTPN